MPEFWLEINYVGFKRVFVTGKLPGADDFMLELDADQKRKLDDFNFKQQQEQQDFLMELVS